MTAAEKFEVENIRRILSQGALASVAASHDAARSSDFFPETPMQAFFGKKSAGLSAADEAAATPESAPQTLAADGVAANSRRGRQLRVPGAGRVP